MPYSLIAVYHHPRETWTQQLDFFKERILPRVTGSNGFASGNWNYDTATSKTHGICVFDSEADARALETMMREEAAQPNPFGIKMESIVVVEQLIERRAR